MRTAAAAALFLVGCSSPARIGSGAAEPQDGTGGDANSSAGGTPGVAAAGAHGVTAAGAPGVGPAADCDRIRYGWLEVQVADDTHRVEDTGGWVWSDLGIGPSHTNPDYPSPNGADHVTTNLLLRGFRPEEGFSPGTVADLATDEGANTVIVQASVGRRSETVEGETVWASYRTGTGYYPDGRSTEGASGIVTIYQFELQDCGDDPPWSEYLLDIRVSGVHVPMDDSNDPDGLYPEEVVVDWAMCSESLERCQSMGE